MLGKNSSNDLKVSNNRHIYDKRGASAGKVVRVENGGTFRFEFGSKSEPVLGTCKPLQIAEDIRHGVPTMIDEVVVSILTSGDLELREGNHIMNVWRDDFLRLLE